MTAISHDSFMRTLKHFIDKGSTTAERELAQMLHDVYTKTAEHPGVVDWLNQRTLEVLDDRNG